MKEILAEYLSCPIRHVITRFGDKWSLLVLYSLWRNNSDPMRFSELHKLMVDCSQKMLSQTLKRLEKNHLIARKQYPEIPPRVEYSLTPLGQSLMPSVCSLIQWGLEHFTEVTDGKVLVSDR
ncbi:MAG: helix-turn-helix transcriptional regulator [Prevotella sp.]|nr:helix-turn-helix transcriptional regulator [Prevotella sp.]